MQGVWQTLRSTTWRQRVVTTGAAVELAVPIPGICLPVMAGTCPPTAALLTCLIPYSVMVARGGCILALNRPRLGHGHEHGPGYRPLNRPHFILPDIAEEGFVASTLTGTLLECVGACSPSVHELADQMGDTIANALSGRGGIPCATAPALAIVALLLYIQQDHERYMERAQPGYPAGTSRRGSGPRDGVDVAVARHASLPPSDLVGARGSMVRSLGPSTDDAARLVSNSLVWPGRGGVRLYVQHRAAG